MKEKLKMMRELLELFEQYASHCRNWEISKEEDFDELEASILEILVEDFDELEASILEILVEDEE